MRSISMAVSTALVAAGVAGGVGMGPPPWAYDPAINGTYTATVVGDWARVREVYHQEAVVRSTWTITTSCATAEDCTGTVTSDQGWSAPLKMPEGYTSYLKRHIRRQRLCFLLSRDPGHRGQHAWVVSPGRKGPDGRPERRLRHELAAGYRAAVQAGQDRVIRRASPMIWMVWRDGFTWRTCPSTFWPAWAPQAS